MTAPFDVMFAAERLLPPAGGAERFVLEALEGLAARGCRVRAIALGDAGASGPPGVETTMVGAPGALDGRWSTWRLRARAVAAEVEGRLAADPADVVVSHLQAGPAVVSAARRHGVPSVLLLQGYEALCHWAFGVGSECKPESRCRACPRARALPAAERGELHRLRDEHDRSLREAAALVAPSRAMADACERLVGRRPLVVSPVLSAPRPAAADPRGHVQLVASYWTRDKGGEMLAPIAARLPDRTIRVQAPAGLAPEIATALASLPNVEVTEAHTDIDDLLDGAALVIVPSQLPDPFPRVAFEAMAAGVPLLASDTGGLREFVPSEQRVGPHDDPAAWEAAARGLEPAHRWTAARERGIAAAAQVVAERPLDRLEAALREAATAERAVAVP